jgi:hypothetical protein
MLDKDEETPKTNGAVAPKESDEQLPLPESPDSEDDRPWRGVFSPEYDREVLFTMDVDLTTLPRWEPHIYIDPRRIADDDVIFRCPLVSWSPAPVPIGDAPEGEFGRKSHRSLWICNRLLTLSASEGMTESHAVA